MNPTRQPLARIVAVAVAGLVSGVVLLLAATNLVPAGSTTFTLLGTLAWAAVGPHLVVASVASVMLAVPISFRNPRLRPARGVLLLSVAALVASGAITSSIVITALRNGGSIDPLLSLAIGSAPAVPDRIATYVVVMGRDQQALIYEPHSAVQAPVILYLHGGGWTSGDAADVGASARWLADRGWLVVSADYRLAGSTDATWDTAPADVGCALAWTAREARSLGADADRLVVMGDSAGGNLAINLGWSAALGMATSSCPALGVVPVPNAVVAGYPVANPGDAYEHGRTWLFGQDPRQFTKLYLGGTPTEQPDRLAAISAATYISAGAPPTLIVQPDRDDFIPAQGNDALVDQARAGGADVTVVRIPFTHHGFDTVSNSLGWQTRLTVTADWLQQRGLAPTR